MEEFTIAMRTDIDPERSSTTFGSWRGDKIDEEIGEIRGEINAYLDAARVKAYKRFSVYQFWIEHQGQFPATCFRNVGYSDPPHKLCL